MILFELSQLKSSIADAIRVSLSEPRGSGEASASSARIGHNLRNLAEAASQFHSAASSTASTIRSGSIATPPTVAHSCAPSGLNGVFPAYKRERVEAYICEAQRQAFTPEHPTSPQPVSVAPPSQAPRPAPPRLAIPTFGNAIGEGEDDDELEFEHMFLEGLEDLARDSIRNDDFGQAVALLGDAISRKQKLGAASEHPDRLEVQLAMCHLFQGNWRRAEPVVLDLIKSSPAPDMVACTMLHAISLAYLRSYSFDRAFDLCKQALTCKKRWLKLSGVAWQASPEYAESLGLLATICEMTGDYISAEIYRRRLPPGYVYKHPADRFEFIAEHRGLLQAVLGTDVPDFCQAPCASVGSSEDLFELDANIPYALARGKNAKQESYGMNTSPLRARRYEWERSESDTSKEVAVHDVDSAICMDDGATSQPTSPVSPISPLKRRLSRMFGSRRAARHGEALSPIQDEEVKRPSPITSWFKDRSVFGLRKPRTPRQAHEDGLLANYTDPYNNKTFRLLRMQRMSLDNMRNPIYRTGSVGETGLGASSGGPAVSASISPLAEFATENAETSPGVSGGGHVHRSDSIQQTPIDTLRDSILDTSFQTNGHNGTIAELPDDPCVPEEHSQRNIESAIRFIHMYSLFSPPSGPPGEGRMSSLAIPDRSNPSVTPEEALVAAPPTFLSGPPQHVRGNQPPETGPDHSGESKQLIAAGGTAVDNQAALLASLASILALLPRLQSSESRHVVRIKLKSIASRLEPVTSDIQVVRDVQRIISNLGNNGSANAKRRGSPRPPRLRDEDPSVPNVASSRARSAPACGGSRPNVLATGRKEDRPILSRSFSWVAESKLHGPSQRELVPGSGRSEWPPSSRFRPEHDEHGIFRGPRQRSLEDQSQGLVVVRRRTLVFF